MQGILITLEGCDGLGKSAQAKMLVEALKGLGHTVYVTKEPGDGELGSPIGPVVRDILFKKTRKAPAGADQLYLLLDHIDNVSFLLPHLEAGETVVCDRSVDSAFAYAAVHAEPTSSEVLGLWNRFRGPEPDITILLRATGPLLAVGDGEVDEDISWALNRARQRTGAEAAKQGGKVWNDYDAQRKVQHAYLSMLSGQARTVIVDIAEQDTVQQVHQRLMALVTRKIQSITAAKQLRQERLLGMLSSQKGNDVQSPSV